jgi:hypothetical protein
MSSLEMYAVRHMGQVVLRKTNQDTRHSAWKAWEQVWSARIGSGSDETGMGITASSAVVGDVDAGCRRAGSGGEGACNVLRHIALVEVSDVPNIAAAGGFDIPFPFRN